MAIPINDNNDFKEIILNEAVLVELVEKFVAPLKELRENTNVVFTQDKNGILKAYVTLIKE